MSHSGAVDLGTKPRKISSGVNLTMRLLMALDLHGGSVMVLTLPLVIYSMWMLDCVVDVLI
jgi:hypothetical protein